MKITILIVEDHDQVRASLREWLSGIFPQVLFLESKTGEEAVDLIRANAPNIILMDIGLPGISGIEAIRKIKKFSPETHIVMVTIYESSHYQTDALAAGATAYVTKRKMHKELIPIIKKLISSSKG